MNDLVSFNPFNKKLEEIIPDDLAILRSVTEGWYVEYKGQIVSVKSIAKSIAAFANHYGGWLFYGIEESSDGSNTAGSFPGLDQSKIVLLIERIRNAAKDVVNPSPYYEYEILTGPCAEIGLPDNRSIVVVLIPSSPNSPHIHADGRIYRRIADASDPRSETDRFILDQLWQRGQNSQEKLATFLQDEPVLSKGEDETSYIELYLLPDPLGAARQRTDLTFDLFTKLMTDTSTPGLSFLCDNFFPMANGFIGRDVNTNDPYNLVSTWKHYNNGFSIVSLPFSSSRIGSITYGGWLHGYDQEFSFLQLMKESSHKTSYLLDVNPVLFSITGAIAQQRRLMKHGNIKGSLYAKAVLRNIWRRIPFLDTKKYISLISEQGFPIIQFTEEFAPYGTTFDSLVWIPEVDSEDNSTHPDTDLIIIQVGSAARIISHILNALGIATKAAFPIQDNNGNNEFEWWNASFRINEVAKHRAKLFNK